MYEMILVDIWLTMTMTVRTEFWNFDLSFEVGWRADHLRTDLTACSFEN